MVFEPKWDGFRAVVSTEPSEIRSRTAPAESRGCATASPPMRVTVPLLSKVPVSIVKIRVGAASATVDGPTVVTERVVR